MTRQEQEEAEQAAYEEHIQALYDEQNWMQQMTEQVEQLQGEMLSERKRADSLGLAYREQQGENDVLRAKLEATQRERDHFRDAWAKAQVRLDCGADATEAVREERAAVVAALVSAANAPHPIERGVPSLSPAGRGLLLLWAGRIERGAHRDRRKEVPRGV